MVEKRASGAAADEGTRAHELLEAKLRIWLPGLSDTWAEDLAIKWGPAPDDMKAAVDVAVVYVAEILADHPDAVMFVEHPFEIPVAAAPGEVWGTCDVVIFVPSLRLLYVIDYKHGAGVFVDVRGNKQLRFYGLGALADLRLTRLDHNDEEVAVANDIDTVALVIIQPRCAVGQPIREEWLAVEDLLEFGKEIGAAVEAAKAPDALLVPGEKQCRFCAAKTICPAREQQALEVAGASFAHVAEVGVLAVPAAHELTDEKIADVLDAKGLIEDWLKAVEAEAETRLRADRPIRGRKLVEAQARRQWEHDAIETAYKLADIANVEAEQFMVDKLRGLMEVESILKTGVSRAEARRRLDAMAFLTIKKSSGKLVVAPESDPRPAAGTSGFTDVQQVEAK